MERLKSKTLWVAVASLVTMILNDAFNIAPEQTKPYVDISLAILAGLGVFANPSNNQAERKKEEKHELQKHS